MQTPSLVVLAAGLGSRYGSFKQIEPIGPNGEIIIDYSISDAHCAGFGNVIIVTKPELELPLREHFASIHGNEFQPLFAFQRTDDLPSGLQLPLSRQKPWGTAHAIWAARNLTDAPFGVINADDYYGPTSYSLLAGFLSRKSTLETDVVTSEYCMVGFELNRTLSKHGTVSRGVCRADSSGHLVDVVEYQKIEPDGTGNAFSIDPSGHRTPLSGKTIVSMNMWGFDASLLLQLERHFRVFLESSADNPKAEFFIPTAVDTLIKEGFCSCSVLESHEQWFGITYREDHLAAVSAVAGRAVAAG